jgi:hypothetical protein
MSPPSPNICPECGRSVPAGSQHQICPACLMAQALASRTIGVNPAAAVPPLTPEEIAGKFPQFEILECLGRGGMGVVYKARQKSLNRLVAIKVLAPERVHEARFAECFAREAELLAQLGHPHIVTIHDFGETGGLFYAIRRRTNSARWSKRWWRLAKGRLPRSFRWQQSPHRLPLPVNQAWLHGMDLSHKPNEEPADTP